MIESRLILASASLLSLLTANAAFAQEAAPDRTDDTGLAEIVVTGTKKARAESLQRVPIAVTAFNREQIETTFARDITDFGLVTPGVRFQTVGTIPGVVNFSIRGMGINSSIASDEPTVGVAIDGVYLASIIGGAVDNFDLESIEILRGPQGTLFGRNVTGGAVVITTRRPKGEFGLDVLSNIGSGGRQEISVAVEDAITSSLAGRVSVSYKHLDGFFKNRAIPGRRVDTRDAWTIRPSFKWEPDAETTVSLIGEYTHDNGGGATVRLVETDPAIGLQRPVSAGGRGYIPPSDPLTLDQNTPSFTNQRIANATLEIKRRVGNGELTSVTGYRNIKVDSVLDQDATSYAIQEYYFRFKQEQLSQELRYAGTTLNDSLDYTLGVYLFGQTFRSQSLVLSPSNPAASNIADGELSERTYAGFGQVEWRFAPTLAVTAGARVSYDRKTADIGAGMTGRVARGACDPTVLPNISCVHNFHGSTDATDFSPKLGLSWKPDVSTMVFGSASRAYRSGGFNVRNYNAAASPGPYMPERVTAFEAGVKRDWFDRRLRTNLTAYYNKFKDLQETVLDTSGISTVLNAASATIWGAEFEGTVIPVRGLTLSGNVGYINASYDAFNGLDLTGDGIPDPALAKNLMLVRAPKWTWSVTGNYRTQVGQLGELMFNASYSYTGRQPLGVPNYAIFDPYKLLDASIRYTTPDKVMTVSIYGKNLTDEYYGTTGFYQSATGRGLYLSPPRSYGVEFAFHF